MTVAQYDPALRPDEQAAFHASIENVRQATRRHLGAAREPAAVVAFVRNVQRAVDDLLADARRDGRPVDCRAGCSHCCSARVEASPPEIFAIAAEIDRRPAPERAVWRDRLEAHGSGQDGDAWQERRPCPFLVDDLCAVYAVRPARCRKAHSLDAAQCASRAATIPQDLRVAAGAEAVIVGAARAHADLGFDSRGYDLANAVVVALSDPTALARWSNGATVFEANERSQAISPDAPGRAAA